MKVNIFNIYNNIISYNTVASIPFTINTANKNTIHTSFNFNNNTLELNSKAAAVAFSSYKPAWIQFELIII